MKSKNPIQPIVQHTNALVKDNESVNDTVDSIVTLVAKQPGLEQRDDLSQVQSTFRLTIINSLVHGEPPEKLGEIGHSESNPVKPSRKNDSKPSKSD